MPETIKLKSAAQLTAEDLADGEFALDEENRLLYVDYGESEGPTALPLDIQPIPPAGEDVPDDAVAIMGADGPTYIQLTTGAGGRPVESEWTVPGVIPINFEDIECNTSIEVGFDVGETLHVDMLRCVPTGGVDIAISFGLKSDAGADLLRFDDSAYAGAIQQACSLTLQPGSYRMFFESESSLFVEVMQALRAWRTEVEQFPLYMKVS